MKQLVLKRTKKFYVKEFKIELGVKMFMQVEGMRF